jgi:hypothetical protein
MKGGQRFPKQPTTTAVPHKNGLTLISAARHASVQSIASLPRHATPRHGKAREALPR